MMFKIPEGDDDATTTVRALFAAKLNEEVDFASVSRLGVRAPNKTRLILVSFLDEDTKMRVLRKSRDWSITTGDATVNISVRPDYTPRQRDLEKELIDEKKSKNERERLDGSYVQWGIRNWEVVKIPPRRN